MADDNDNIIQFDTIKDGKTRIKGEKTPREDVIRRILLQILARIDDGTFKPDAIAVVMEPVDGPATVGIAGCPSMELMAGINHAMELTLCEVGKQMMRNNTNNNEPDDKS